MLTGFKFISADTKPNKFLRRSVEESFGVHIHQTTLISFAAVWSAAGWCAEDTAPLLAGPARHGRQGSIQVSLYQTNPGMAARVLCRSAFTKPNQAWPLGFYTGQPLPNQTRHGC